LKPAIRDFFTFLLGGVLFSMGAFLFFNQVMASSVPVGGFGLLLDPAHDRRVPAVRPVQPALGLVSGAGLGGGAGGGLMVRSLMAYDSWDSETGCPGILRFSSFRLDNQRSAVANTHSARPGWIKTSA